MSKAELRVGDYLTLHTDWYYGNKHLHSRVGKMGKVTHILGGDVWISWHNLTSESGTEVRVDRYNWGKYFEREAYIPTKQETAPPKYDRNTRFTLLIEDSA